MRGLCTVAAWILAAAVLLAVQAARRDAAEASLLKF